MAIMNLNILYEDNHLIAVEKEAGILSQKDSSDVPSLLEYVKGYIKKEYNKSGNVYLGLVHRLDKPTSGVQVFAKTSKAARRLHQEFAGRHTVKMYIALIESHKGMETGEWFEREDSLLKKRGYSELSETDVRNAQSAKMKFMAVRSNENYSLLLVNIMTGRKHQIRAQLAAMGLPIVGDNKYGSTHSMDDNSICLHAYFIRFMHPTKKTPVDIFSKIPDRILKKIAIDEELMRKIENTIKSQTLSSEAP
jgi:23S rRNA pseudouridine1911/1915/1917 synthase